MALTAAEQLRRATINIPRALRYLNVQYSGGQTDYDNQVYFTQEEYNNSIWVGIDPKPTWEQILEANNQANLQEVEEQKQFVEDQLLRNNTITSGLPRDKLPKYIREELSGGQTIDIDGVATHVHGGVDRMTGLISMVEDANESGETIPLVVMRDEDNTPIEIHTQEEIRPILNKVRQRKNIVESAHNRVMQRYQEIANRRDAPATEYGNEGDSVDKLKAAYQAVEVLRFYKDYLEGEIRRYNPDALPTDLDKLKMVYQERLEAKALERSKYFKGVVTQQGVDLNPSCEDEATALAAVAKAEREASIKVNSSDTEADIKAAYDAGVTAINAVLPTRTPEFLLNGTPLGAAPANQQLSVTTFTVWADHPVGLNLTQRVGLSFTLLKDGKKLRDRTGIDISRSTNVRDGTRRGITVTFDPAVLAGQTIDMEFQARSICGPSDMKVRVIVPSS